MNTLTFENTLTSLQIVRRQLAELTLKIEAVEKAKEIAEAKTRLAEITAADATKAKERAQQTAKRLRDENQKLRYQKNQLIKRLEQQK